MSFKYNNIRIGEENLRVGVYCPAFFCNPEFIKYHEKVFKKFNIVVNYIKEPQPHGEILTQLSRNEDVDYFCFVDVDAVPLSRNTLTTLIRRVHGNAAIIGIEQHSNREGLKNRGKTYAGPAFFIIFKKVYALLGKPSYMETHRSDCGEELSYAARDKNVEVKYIKFSNCIQPLWYLEKGVKFGIGSTYEDLVYHNFQARDPATLDLFVKKCKSILNE